jgi:O-palmitoleoyl-L-serine hydrolase
MKVQISVMTVILLLMSIALTKADSNYKLHLLPQTLGSACLDGSPAGFYLHEGKQSDKFMIYFDRGGFCGDGSLSDTLKSCYHRSFTSLGTTKNYKAEKSFDSEGLLSTLESENPLFYDWNKLFVIYCDGSEYQGSRNDTISFKDVNLHFRGALNVMELFKHLDTQYDIYNSDKIVISGVSAGGIATYHWSNYLYEHAKTAKVYAIPDSGFFLVDYFSPLVGQKVIR